MEQDIGFHGSEQGESRYSSRFVEEVCSSNCPVLTLLCGVANYQIDQVHLSDDILKRTDVCIGDLAAGGDVAKSMEVVEKMI